MNLIFMCATTVYRAWSNAIRLLILCCTLPILSACNDSAREDRLVEREAYVNTRESELVTLFAELVAQKKSLEDQHAVKYSDESGENPDSQQPDCLPTTNGNPSTKTDAGLQQIKNKVVFGSLEYVYLDPPGLEFSARIDTGARTSSLNAITLTEFERDGKPYVKFTLRNPQTDEIIEITRRLRRYVKIKERGNREAQQRPVVRMRVTLGSINELIDFTLENRSKFKHQVLIGRNLLRDLAVVDVSERYMTKVDSAMPPVGATKP
ncbi:RimK/LysX family protein [Nitrosomonas sp. PY1]|uniref:ATP-dependent zinc protease family protein n=1 Tax=Nitrosomonas sp. PY1 TaxID=1803906 RepID=UPI001FC85905|nr:RimK/LysX family protein [Nitrosomonas sp. PY1]